MSHWTLNGSCCLVGGMGARSLSVRAVVELVSLWKPSDIYELVSLFAPGMHIHTFTHTNLYNYPYEDIATRMVFMHFNFNQFISSSKLLILNHRLSLILQRSQINLFVYLITTFDWC